MNKLITGLLLGAASLGAAHAGDFTISGFGTLAAGKAYGGTQGQWNEFDCPCYIANYEHGAVYDKSRVSLAEESLAGVQLKYKFSEQLSATAQVVSRASEKMKGEIDWAYVTWDITPETTLQAGRRRLPIYAYSDSVYIGYTLPWIRVPQDIYGWEIGAYNGVNLSHRKTLGDWAVIGNIFTGQEVTKNNKEMERIYYGARVDDAWKRILGGYLDVSNDYVGVRMIYMQNTIDLTSYPAAAEDAVVTRGLRQRIMGVSASVDYNNFLLRAEANTFRRPAQDYKARSWTATAGYKIGDFTPLAGYSHYTEKQTDLYTDLQIDNTRFVALRWDFRKNMDLKIQFDKVIDRSHIAFSGNSKLVSVALDAVF
ncbi:porin [Pseudoduganella aquatica]|uniref:Porin n=1 Tax=Pseudoduganella aquatica TaxID=2660641 RepID=A0A7X4KKI8_9BURK|nr:porin [Pseudoduganella aquatica]MYN07164.1 porin [Pseudoduganella aquatica]